ncbi:DUF1289 domain-containing protein [Pseudoalteromonas citrea]|uniref:DUF1289 domain-containing protein n=1 Tax=Pseudoalteromonas citrea TaxID=43655 RepID=A0A5S3XTK6_9GAMM|nr:DUF1289 domain-containing protein [Pseudoalteromonas citrea]TMP44366.1 DUF1289 domain-containing protein [Pseudoalteromonas citrea]TMP60739.1 DUF1289 domain-containing protein [Pseudoalteromonas citrea]
MAFSKQNRSDILTPTIEQPCIRHCCLDSHERCIGCFRMLDEILSWHTYSEREKEAVLVKCRSRQKGSN